MALMLTLKKLYWIFAFAGGFYFVFLSLLLNGWVQRQTLYLHQIKSLWWQDPNKPENYGFLKNQVRPFSIDTPDGEVLYAWHVLPIALYAKHEDSLIAERVSLDSKDVTSTAFKLLANDPDSRLVIIFHGNAGTVIQGWRTDTYRSIASGAADKIHILTVDYRGFGYSTGFPYENGLITDGIALVNWALQVARIPPERILLLGQSLGTAVATAVAEHFVKDEVEFRGLVLVAPFSDIPTLMSTYAIGGAIPILSPLRPYPFLQQFFARRIQETWFTAKRMKNLVRKSRRIHVHLIHSKDDFDIPWTHSDTLFAVAADATTERGLSLELINAHKIHVNLNASGFTNSWVSSLEDSGKKSIKQEIVNHGGTASVSAST